MARLAGGKAKAAAKTASTLEFIAVNLLGRIAFQKPL
jgi:hypothetical protein